YLCAHLDTNIIVYEYDKVPKLHSILKNVDTGVTNVNHIFMPNISGNQIFHRTKFLNEMLAKVKTPVVVNYDVDILLAPEVYKKCSDLISNGADLVYPYFWGDSQHQINYV